MVVNSVGVFRLHTKESIDLTLVDSTRISNIKRMLIGSKVYAVVTNANEMQGVK